MTVCDRSKCTGCGVCADACPRDCIEIKYDQNGFLQSYVDESRCVGCQKCVRVCPVNTPQNHNTMLRSFKFRRKDTAALMGSTSGGAAALLAETVTAHGGQVCGSGFDSNLQLRHTVESEPTKLEKFKGSKYIQSQTGGIYRQIRHCLQEGTQLLFIGTPCQVSALQSFLGRDYENLITVDLVCHGVASTKVLEKYLDQAGREQLCSIRFRSKTNGYIDCQKNDLRLIYSDGEKTVDHAKGIVLWFAAGLSLRESCYRCQFASSQRCADLTLADYVGKDLTPEEQQYGVSMVFANTPKGEQMLQHLETDAWMEEIPVEDARQRYLCLKQKGSIPGSRKRFFRDLDKLPLSQLEQKYTLQAILPSKPVRYLHAAVNRFKQLIKVKSE